MRIIAVASQKGGSGKTTLAGHLGIAAERAGTAPSVFIDTDPQGSLAAWWNAREAETPAFVQAPALDLDDALSSLRADRFKLAVIDTPPVISRDIDHVIRRADLVVVPVRPSPHDLRAAGATVDMVERAGKPMVFVVNGANMRARLTGEAAIALSQHGVVAPSICHQRQDFAASMIDGRTVLEVDPESRSSMEVTALWHYLAERLERLPLSTAFSTSGPTTASRGFGPRPGFGRANGATAQAAGRPFETAGRL